MKHLIIFIIIIVGILLIKCSIVEKFVDLVTNKYKIPDVYLKYSYQVESNGIFANKKFNKGDLIEICPALLEKTEILQNTEKLINYFFHYDEEKSLIGLGYCSMYNHSDTPNASWHVLDESTLRIKAYKDIAEGEEIFISYGDEYWNTRKELLKK
jgi:hypothetical protein